MRFGTRKADVVQSTTGGGKYINYFKDGAQRLVFLDDLDDWHKFWDHYSVALQKSFPCTGERDTCPGCTAENKKDQRASGKYLVNAKDPDTGYVNLWKIPASLMPSLERIMDKDTTVTGRIFAVYRSKAHDRVNYSLTREDPYREVTDDDMERKQDFEEALLTQYVEAWGEEPDDSESPVQSAPEPKKQPAKPRKRAASKGEYIDEIEAQPEEETPPFDEDKEIDEEQLNSMGVGDLLNLFEQAGISDVPDSTDPDVLRNALIEALGE